MNKINNTIKSCSGIVSFKNIWKKKGNKRVTITINTDADSEIQEPIVEITGFDTQIYWLMLGIRKMSDGKAYQINEHPVKGDYIKIARGIYTQKPWIDREKRTSGINHRIAVNRPEDFAFEKAKDVEVVGTISVT